MTTATAGKKATLGLAIGAIGVVYGDIGTSPLYAMKATLAVSGTSQAAIYGVISLIFWTLMLVVTVKYLSFVMRADNHGEGGILALLALLPAKYLQARRGTKILLLLTILAGTALLFGDGALTPAISVLSATEGLGLVNENLSHYAVPITVVILAVLFAVQSKGTHKIGRIFGPVMVAWFVTIGLLGLWRLSQDFSTFAALSPTYAISYIYSNPTLALALGSTVILVATGAEALYADLAHFGLKPIRLAWVALIAPSLILCYLGQASVVMHNPEAAEDPFFSLSPNSSFTFALVILSTVATVIASQALITGVFSLSRQAVQLGLFPRLTIRHTHAEHEGQIYVPIANWLLGATSIALVIGFGSSSALASAYVLAIAGTMMVTTIAFYRVTRDRWGWGLKRAVPLVVLFLIIDSIFLTSTATKILDGGWVPVLLAAAVLTVMLVWRRGQRMLRTHVDSSVLIWDDVASTFAAKKAMRTPGEAVILASHIEQVPQALASCINLLHAVPQTVTILTITTQPIPTVADEDRLTIKSMGHGVRQVIVNVGFAETPSVPLLLQDLPGEETERVYYLSDRTFLATNAGEMGHFSETFFSFLHRNAARPGQFFGLPDDKVVTLSTHLDL